MAFCDYHYFSPALGRQTAANILLPEVGTPPYPVMYLLHGLSDDHTMWSRRSSIERHVANIPLIVVMPDGGRGFYTDAVDAGQPFLTAIAVELVDRIDRTFPTEANRENRCVTGLSMGGYGALKFALAYPERFASAVSMSGAVGWGHSAAGRDGEPLTEEWKHLLGPDPVGGPNDLYSLVQTVDPDLLPKIRIDCGVDDFLIDDNRKFHTHLDTVNIPHEYTEYPGGHTWDYWDEHVQDAIAFHKKALGF